MVVDRFTSARHIWMVKVEGFRTDDCCDGCAFTVYNGSYFYFQPSFFFLLNVPKEPDTVM